MPEYDWNLDDFDSVDYAKYFDEYHNVDIDEEDAP